MKTKIAIDIETHDDGVHCGECMRLQINRGSTCPWAVYNAGDAWTRGHKCLAAEKKLRDLIEAGWPSTQSMDDSAYRKWKEALAAIDAHCEERKP